ncbi:MAG: FeoB-associated Cys-rich membrane protein [Lachnospiraceae bacterium]|nr:FeoB-associated Cys-rich membrane protein [Lachnospiraceae bacterium]
MGTAVVLIVLAGIVAAILCSMVRDKKAGKSLQCGNNCAACGGHCHAQAAQKEK